jgi:hypothetical protein
VHEEFIIKEIVSIPRAALRSARPYVHFEHTATKASLPKIMMPSSPTVPSPSLLNKFVLGRNKLRSSYIETLSEGYFDQTNYLIISFNQRLIRGHEPGGPTG